MRDRQPRLRLGQQYPGVLEGVGVVFGTWWLLCKGHTRRGLQRNVWIPRMDAVHGARGREQRSPPRHLVVPDTVGLRSTTAAGIQRTCKFVGVQLRGCPRIHLRLFAPTPLPSLPSVSGRRTAAPSGALGPRHPPPVAALLRHCPLSRSLLCTRCAFKSLRIPPKPHRKGRTQR